MPLTTNGGSGRPGVAEQLFRDLVDSRPDRRIARILLERGEGTSEGSLVGGLTHADRRVGAHDEGADERPLPGAPGGG